MACKRKNKEQTIFYTIVKNVLVELNVVFDS